MARKKASGNSAQPAPSENDYVAHVAAELRRLWPMDDVILEEREIGSRRRKDIVVRHFGKVVFIIEVKRPDKFKTPTQREKANKQVVAYAKAEGCVEVGITDGTTYIAINVNTGKTQERELLSFAKSALRIGFSPTLDRPGWVSEEFLLFPERQRQKHPLSIPANLYVPRRFPSGFSFVALFRSQNPVHIILGVSDIGKSALSWTLAESPHWNAIRLDGAALTDGVEAVIRRDIVAVYERCDDVMAFLQRVAEVSLAERGVPLGVVLDGFDDWMAVSSELHDLPAMIDRLSAFNCKIIILSRPSEKHRLLNSTLLARFTNESEVITLGELEDEQLDEFIQKYFTVFQIGGTLSGNARKICRNPAMLSIVSETFAGSSEIRRGLAGK